MDTAVIKLDFRPQNDGTYEVYSFTSHRDLKVVCKVSYKMYGERLIYLRETEVVKINAVKKNVGLQNMKLTIAKDFKSMRGSWSYNEFKSKSGKKIYFVKKT